MEASRSQRGGLGTSLAAGRTRGAPPSAPPWLSLALEADRLLDQQRLDEAADRAAASVRLNPDSAIALHALGMVCWHRGRPQESLEHLRRAVAVCPDLAAAHNGLGLCLAQLGDHDAALREYELALILQPDHAFARFNRAAQLLRRGRYADGWVEYEWRWAAGRKSPPDIPRPRWDGRPLDGRALLVHTEQGIGDTLMFLRFLPRVKRRPGDRLVFACPQALRPLLRGLPGVDRWLPIDQPAAIDFDVFLPMMSLPGVLGLGEADIPYPGRTSPPTRPASRRAGRGWRPCRD